MNVEINAFELAEMFGLQFDTVRQYEYHDEYVYTHHEKSFIISSKDRWIGNIENANIIAGKKFLLAIGQCVNWDNV